MSIDVPTDFDLHLLGRGDHRRLFEILGAHPEQRDGVAGTRFAVWAPSARGVSVVGDFNGWDPEVTPLQARGGPGVWAGFVPGLGEGGLYKYAILPGSGGPHLLKADPFGFGAEGPPRTASIVRDLSGFAWGDSDWMSHRAALGRPEAPISIYEVHLGSWRRVSREGNRPLSYAELAEQLADYVLDLGFTHVELMPVGEHPFTGSWGYQQTGFFAPTARFGTPKDFMGLVDALHRHGLGVILDWVPAHFPLDPHGLARFDGTELYEHPDPRRGLHPTWDTGIFDYERPEVVNFLLANALFWLERYHIDGLRVDAVESMLYLDFHRKPGEWQPNRHGGNENLAAIDFLRHINEQIHAEHPGVITIAEDSSARPGITRPVAEGGLGFDYKWDLGWIHDSVDSYLRLDPGRRSEAHGRLTFRMHYAFNERYVLPLSHDEVKPGVGSFFTKMPGDDAQKFANLRLLLGYQYALTGKKHLFMGTEFGQRAEWDHDQSLDWHLLDDPRHAGVRRLVRDLNALYRSVPALHRGDASPDGFAWVEGGDVSSRVLSFLRRDPETGASMLILANFSGERYDGYRVGVPRGGRWAEILNSDAEIYGGSGLGNLGGRDAEPWPCHGRSHSLAATLAPLSIVFFKEPHG